MLLKDVCVFGRSVRRPGVGLTVAVALAGCVVLAGAAAADRVSRPIRDTSDRSLTSTGKVLVAVRTSELGRHHYLHRATRGYLGYPVRCGVSLGDLHQATYVVKRLPTRYRYDSRYDLCRTRKPGWATSYGGGHAAAATASAMASTHNPQPHASAAAPTRTATARRLVTVIATGPAKLTNTPAAMRDDPWALLNAGRYRDARGVFEKQLGSNGSDNALQAGLALATALSGDLDAGADALAELGGDAAAMRALPVQPALASKLALLADTLYADRPDAQRILRMIAGTDAPGAA